MRLLRLRRPRRSVRCPGEIGCGPGGARERAVLPDRCGSNAWEPRKHIVVLSIRLYRAANEYACNRSDHPPKVLLMNQAASATLDDTTGGPKMRRIVTTLHRAADLSRTMDAMRVWLDEHRCEPSKF